MGTGKEKKNMKWRYKASIAEENTIISTKKPPWKHLDHDNLYFFHHWTDQNIAILSSLYIHGKH